MRTAGSIDPKATQQAFVLEAEDLDLAQLLALVDLEGLSGEGTARRQAADRAQRRGDRDPRAA